MRASARVLVACSLLLAPLGSSAFAAPILTSATLDYTDSVGPLPQIAVTVGAGVEFCGAAGPVSCSGSDLTTGAILLQNDTIDFSGLTVVFTLEFNAEVTPGSGGPPYWFGLSDATFTLSNFAFSNNGQLLGIDVAFGGNLLGGASIIDTPGGQVALQLNGITVASPGMGTITVTLQARDGNTTPLPEPTSMLLLGAGLLASAGAARRRRSSR